MLFVTIVVSMEINRRHYFRSGPRTFLKMIVSNHVGSAEATLGHGRVDTRCVAGRSEGFVFDILANS